MSNSQFASKRALIRIAITLCLCLGLVVLVLTEFPSNSRARQRSSQQSARKKQTRPRFVPGEVLVQYRSESMARSRTGRNVVASRTGELVAMEVERRRGADLVEGLRLVHVAPEDTLKAVAALRAQPDVLYAEPNYIMKAAAIPNDQWFLDNRQFALSLINAQQAWDVTTGSSSIVVGVIDQGIDFTHEDLQSNMWTNPAEIAGNNVDDDANGVIDDVHGANFTPEGPANGNIFSNTDPETHASHVAGIIGAKGNNTVGISGVNWNVGLMSLKFLDADGFGDTMDAIDACTYAKTMRDKWVQSGGTSGANIRVLNASFGGTAFSQLFLNAINGLNSSGILFVTASGNIDNGTREPNNDLVPHFPSSFEAPNVVAVAATNSVDNMTSFSHFGATSVDLAAPGAGVLSTTPPCSDPGPFPKPCEPSFPVNATPTQDTYSFFSGTSMAAPHVSGSAALLWAHNPALTVQQVKNLLMLNGDVVTELLDKTLTGRRLNVGASVQSLQENDSTAPGTVTNFQLNAINGRTVTVGWTAAGDDGAGGGAAKLYELNFVDGGSGAVIPLKGLIPANPGVAQTAQVTIPYRHTSGTLRLRSFDNKGNEGTPANLLLTVPALSGDPYEVTVGGAAPLSTGGERLNLDGDDRYADFLLPAGFVFPFFGANFTELTISSNGNLFFSAPPVRIGLPPGNLDEADDPPGSPRMLGGYQMIAGLWEDLDLTNAERADAGVYIGTPDAGGVLQTPTSNSTRIVFRWQGVPCNFNGQECLGGAPVNFEIELNKDGTIRSRYGSGNTNLLPTVGIGGGGQDGYVVTSHTSEENPRNLTNAGQVTYTPRGPWSAATLPEAQVELKNWTIGGRTSIYVKLNFPDTGFRIVDWGNPSQSGNAFTVNTAVEKSNGVTIPAISNTAQIWDLGTLAPGDYTFTFRTSGTTARVLNFTVSSTAPPANPIDEAREFVRWQYKDFLRREPDGPGSDHWTGEITLCTDPAKRQPGESEIDCVARKRANTSAAFFLSPEFQTTGYFVLRVYRGSLGRMPHFGGGTSLGNEFTRDAGTVSAGIVVNNQLDPNVINANKQAFVNEFVTRFEFRSIYDGLNDTQYVDKLFDTTGVTPSPADRTALIAEAGTPGGRAKVLFKVVDGTTTINNEGHLRFDTTYGKAFYDNLFNPAFVRMQYFGYLLRDPDDAGFAFWLGKLNQFGNFVDAQMVLAFINSPEYRSRFGAP
ncbi:MAG TPA: S8 family serine peptidase [Pyrinomonadaceae bacterium]|nr:S8 family serine peptidase [Pyrinomonadaceae bacterium]